MQNEGSRTVARHCSYQDNFTPPEHRKFRRIHGLQLPLHPQQVVGWFILLLLTAGTFAVLIPQLGSKYQPFVYGIIGGSLIIHLLSHLTVLLLDPADSQVRAQPSSTVVPEFDRSKHLHVIENGRCHLCNINTKSKRTKHCSICNKCIPRFDHHCKWLNNCIGSRNYRIFLICLISAVVSTLLVVCLSITELILTNNSANVNFWSVTMDNTTIPILHIPGTGSLIVISMVGILSAIVAILLIHLCFFHGYIACLGMTTYEYVRNKREKNISVLSNTNFMNENNACPSFYKNEKVPVKYHFCKSAPQPTDGETEQTKNIYICSTHGMQNNSNSNYEGTPMKDRRNFHLYFSYEARSSETSVEVSSQTIDTDYVQSQNALDLKSSTPSPVSCCFSIMNPVSMQNDKKQRKHKEQCEDIEEEKSIRKSCKTIRRIQTFFRRRLKRSRRQSSLGIDVIGRKQRIKNKITPISIPDTLEKEESDLNMSSDKEISAIQPLPSVKLPPLNLSYKQRTKEVTFFANDTTCTFTIPDVSKRNQAHLRVRRLSLHKRPRFKVNSLVTQSAPLSPIPESEFSKPASPHLLSETNHFAFPPFYK